MLVVENVLRPLAFFEGDAPEPSGHAVQLLPTKRRSLLQRATLREMRVSTNRIRARGGDNIVRYISRVFAILGMFLVAGCETNQETVVDRIEITGFGIFEYEGVRIGPDDTSSTGAKLGAAKGLKLSAQTTRIPIRPGRAYGVRFVVHGNPPDSMVNIKVVLRSTDACVLRDTGQVVYHNDSVLRVRIGEIRHIGGRFPESEEENHCTGAPQPGTETLELYHGDRKLAEKTFQIVTE